MQLAGQAIHRPLVPGPRVSPCPAVSPRVGPAHVAIPFIGGPFIRRAVHPALFAPPRAIRGGPRNRWQLRQPQFILGALRAPCKTPRQALAISPRIVYAIPAPGDPSPRASWPMALLGNSSMVELRTLTPSILVRIQVPQPNTSKPLTSLTRLLARARMGLDDTPNTPPPSRWCPPCSHGRAARSPV